MVPSRVLALVVVVEEVEVEVVVVRTWARGRASGAVLEVCRRPL